MNIFNLFFDTLNGNNNNNLKIRKVRLNGNYVFTLHSYENSNRSIEFEGNKRGNIKLLGGLKEKNLKPFFDKYYLSAPIFIKIPNKNRIKKKYTELIEECDFKRIIKIKEFKPIAPVKNNGIKNSSDISTLKYPIDEKRESLVKDLVIKTLKEKELNIFKLNKIIDTNELVEECINIFRKKDIITVDTINDLILDKIHNYAILN